MASQPPDSYRCEECGGVFTTSDDWNDEQAHEEAIANFRQRGDVPGMAIVCDDCFREIMAYARAARENGKKGGRPPKSKKPRRLLAEE